MQGRAGCTPDSVVVHHLSRRPAGSPKLDHTSIRGAPQPAPGAPWLGGRYPPSPVTLRRDQTMWSSNQHSPVHSPCSQVHARPAGSVTAAAGGLLPHRFTPHPHPEKHSGPLAGFLSVAVVVNGNLRHRCPHLRFRGAPLPRSQIEARSREVPLSSPFGCSAMDRLLAQAFSPQL